jgi:uncharacterized membrane protein (DUF485 family)
MNECPLGKMTIAMRRQRETSGGTIMKAARIGGAAIWSSAIICAIYFALLWLSVSARAFLRTLIAPGVSVGFTLTLLGIVAAIGLTWWFVRDANAKD